MWKATHSEIVAASAASVWNRWTDVESWPDIDPSLTSASIYGSFEFGRTITLRPKKAPAMKLVLALVTPDVGFAMVGRLPLCKLQFTHHLESSPGGTKITESVSLSGPLFWLYAAILGNRLQTQLIQRLKRTAELFASPEQSQETTP